MTRKLLITSVGSGVGHAILAALRRIDGPWYVVGVNSVAFNAGPFNCDSAWLVSLAWLCRNASPWAPVSTALIMRI